MFPTMQPSTKLMATPISPTDSDRRAAGGLRENRSRPSVIAAEQEQDAGRLDREQVQPAGEQAPQAILPTAAEPPHREAGRGVLDEDRLPRIGILPPHPSCGFFDKATGPPISATCATCTGILCIVNRRDRTVRRHSLVIANVTHSTCSGQFVTAMQEISTSNPLARRDTPTVARAGSRSLPKYSR